MARLSAKDIRSHFGSNLGLIGKLTKLDPWEDSHLLIRIKLSSAEIKNVPAEDEWRVDLLSKLLRSGLKAYYEGNTKEETRLSDLIRSLTIF